MARVFEVIEVKERIQKNVKQFKMLLDKYIELKEKLSVIIVSHRLSAVRDADQILVMDDNIVIEGEVNY